MDLVVTKGEQLALIRQMLDASDMCVEPYVHIQLIASHGFTRKLHQDPRINIGIPMILIIIIIIIIIPGPRPSTRLQMTRDGSPARRRCAKDGSHKLTGEG